MDQDILISVIVPIYNIMDCLEKCVTSIRNQTYRNLEIILVDDGSTDGTAVLVDRLGGQDERIQVFHKQNGGSSSARNLGLAHARGEYIGFVDSDDYISPKMYEILISSIVQNHTKMAQISRDEIDDEGNRLPDVCIPPTEEIRITAQDMLRELLMHRGDCSFCTRLTHRSLFTDRSFPQGRLNEDFSLLTDMLQEIASFMILPQQYYHVFYRIGSNTRKKEKDVFPQVFTDIVVNADAVAKLVDKSYPALRQVCIRFGLFQRLDYLLHIPISMMNRSNTFYQKQVCGYLRSHFLQMLFNPYLTGKNKVYLLLLTIAPKTVRTVHASLHK